ncbi:MAG: hydrogenase iron-sulfur subunit [Syntrophorhabdaceae bacterium]|nr:hydrogenase iron-sulfur subunit [Syntrophorhabdaceae bacterium]
METKEERQGLNFYFFFCQRIDKEQEKNRRTIEKSMGDKVRLFPIPCSGRIEPIHILRALEKGADKVYVLTCREGLCRYREGNLRAKKRVSYAQKLMEEIGLEKERVELINLKKENGMTIDTLVEDLVGKKTNIGSSPLNKPLL